MLDDRPPGIETRDLPADHLTDLARSGRAALAELYDGADQIPDTEAAQHAEGLAAIAAVVSRAEADLAEQEAEHRAEHARRGTLTYWLDLQHRYDERFPWLAQRDADRAQQAAEQLAAQDRATVDRRADHLYALTRHRAHTAAVRARYPRPEATP
jgi:hypothetical protein